MIKIILILSVIALMVIPASAQAPAPSGYFGYDEFDHPLNTYNFWSGYNSDVSTLNGELIMTFYNQDHWIFHNIPNFNGNLTTFRVRFNYAQTSGVGRVALYICGDMLDYNFMIGDSPRFTGNPCGYIKLSRSGSFVDYDLALVFRRYPTDLLLAFMPDPDDYYNSDGELHTIWQGRLGYFSVTCEVFCPENIITATPSPTRTPIIAPTGIPRTPTAYPSDMPTPTNNPIGLTRPPTSGDSEPDCGVYVCGAVDLSFPVLPPLNSPTPLSLGNLVGLTQVALVTSVSGDYVPSTPIFSDGGNTDNLGGYIGGDGVLTPQNPGGGNPSLADLADGALSPQDNSIFISYLKGIYNDEVDYFGPFAPIVQVALAVFSLLFLMMTYQFIMPIAVLFVSLARKAWHVVLELIPF